MHQLIHGIFFNIIATGINWIYLASFNFYATVVLINLDFLLTNGI